jgi:hypothetical protein
MKKIISIGLFFLLFPSISFSKAFCDYLYVGKGVKVEVEYSGLFGTRVEIEDAIIIGISPSNNEASVKLNKSGQILNGSCGRFVTKSERDNN